MKYKAIVIDPPVPFKLWGGGKEKTASRHYEVVSWEWLKSLGTYIHDVADDDCAIFLWTCPPLLQETLDMVDGWNAGIYAVENRKKSLFQYKTRAFLWEKLNRRAGTPFVGLGYWTRANPEDVLLFTRGRVVRKNKAVQQLVRSVIRRHSEKPEDVQDRIEQLVDGPYLEMFARRQRSGWTCVGNEIDGLDIKEALTRLANT